MSDASGTAPKQQRPYRRATPQDDAIREQAYKIYAASKLLWQWQVALRGAWRKSTKQRCGEKFAQAHEDTLREIDKMKELCRGD